MFDITGRHIKNSEASTYITFSNFYVSVKLIVVSVALKRVFDKYVTVVFLTDQIKQDIIYVCVWRMFPTFKTCSLQLVVYKGSDQIIVKQITQNGALQIHFWNNRTFLTTGHFWNNRTSNISEENWRSKSTTCIETGLCSLLAYIYKWFPFSNQYPVGRYSYSTKL